MYLWLKSNFFYAFLQNKNIYSAASHDTRNNIAGRLDSILFTNTSE